MLRTIGKVLAGTVMFSALMTGTALAADPVGVVENTTAAVGDATGAEVPKIVIDTADVTCSTDVRPLLDTVGDLTTADPRELLAGDTPVAVACDVDGGTPSDGAEVDGVGGVTGVTKAPGAVTGAIGGVTAQPTSARSAVVGYIRIVWTAQGGASYWLSGALQDGNQWSCVGDGDTSSYTVTCSPVRLPVGVRYTCDVLHADIATTSAAGSGRTSLDCDSDGIPEARTRHVAGSGGRDFRWAVDTRPVTKFTCTVDLVVPNITSGCGDPGLVSVE